MQRQQRNAVRSADGHCMADHKPCKHSVWQRQLACTRCGRCLYAELAAPCMAMHCKGGHLSQGLSLRLMAVISSGARERTDTFLLLSAKCMCP